MWCQSIIFLWENEVEQLRFWEIAKDLGIPTRIGWKREISSYIRKVVARKTVLNESHED